MFAFVIQSFISLPEPRTRDCKIVLPPLLSYTWPCILIDEGKQTSIRFVVLFMNSCLAFLSDMTTRDAWRGSPTLQLRVALHTDWRCQLSAYGFSNEWLVSLSGPIRGEVRVVNKVISSSSYTWMLMRCMIYFCDNWLYYLCWVCVIRRCSNLCFTWPSVQKDCGVSVTFWLLIWLC